MSFGGNLGQDIRFRVASEGVEALGFLREEMDRARASQAAYLEIAQAGGEDAAEAKGHYLLLAGTVRALQGAISDLVKESQDAAKAQQIIIDSSRNQAEALRTETEARETAIHALAEQAALQANLGGREADDAAARAMEQEADRRERLLIIQKQNKQATYDEIANKRALTDAQQAETIAVDAAFHEYVNLSDVEGRVATSTRLLVNAQGELIQVSNRAHSNVMAMGRAHDQSAVGIRRSQMAAIEFTRAIEDLSVSGPIGAINNLNRVFEQVAYTGKLSTAAIVGFSAGLTALGLAANYVFRHWDEIQEKLGQGIPQPALDGIEGLKKGLEKSSEEMDKLAAKTRLTFPELLRLKELRDEISGKTEEVKRQERLAGLLGEESEAQRAAGAGFKEAITEVPGGAQSVLDALIDALSRQADARGQVVSASGLAGTPQDVGERLIDAAARGGVFQRGEIVETLKGAFGEFFEPARLIEAFTPEQAAWEDLQAKNQIAAEKANQELIEQLNRQGAEAETEVRAEMGEDFFDTPAEKRKKADAAAKKAEDDRRREVDRLARENVAAVQGPGDVLSQAVVQGLQKGQAPEAITARLGPQVATRLAQIPGFEPTQAEPVARQIVQNEIVQRAPELIGRGGLRQGGAALLGEMAQEQARDVQKNLDAEQKAALVQRFARQFQVRDNANPREAMDMAGDAFRLWQSGVGELEAVQRTEFETLRSMRSLQSQILRMQQVQNGLQQGFQGIQNVMPTQRGNFNAAPFPIGF